MLGDALPEEERRLLEKLRAAGLPQQDAPQLGSLLLGELADSVQEYGREKEEHFLRRCAIGCARDWRVIPAGKAAPLRTLTPVASCVPI